MYYETVWTFRTTNFDIRYSAAPDDCPVDVDDDGEAAAAVNAGDLCHFVARLQVIHRATGAELGADHLGSCIYESPADFIDHRGIRQAERAASAECGRAVVVGSLLF